jgi:hypothetical protein
MSDLLVSGRRCRHCGCTDDHACPGGCYWVEDDLCSECAHALAETATAIVDGMGIGDEAPIVCPHTKVLYDTPTHGRCLGCGEELHDG